MKKEVIKEDTLTVEASDDESSDKENEADAANKTDHLLGFKPVESSHTQSGIQ